MGKGSPRVLITGASGTLGGPLTVRAVRSGWEVLGTYLTHPDRICAGQPVQLDLRDEAATRQQVDTFRPDVILHAAITERSGPGFDGAIRLAGANLARIAAEHKIRLIALSTDLIFDGTESLYSEETPPRPWNAYGYAKADAEREILAACPGALVVRTSLIYDFDRENAQVAWMLRAVERGEPVRLFADQIRCPIWAVNLADALLELARGPAAGILNVVGPEPLSRYDLGMALLSALGIEGRVIPAAAPDTQPKRLILSLDRARAVLQTPLLTLAQARACWSTASRSGSNTSCR
jgi:dTDP-4-dehydrorhamnose reductase